MPVLQKYDKFHLRLFLRTIRDEMKILLFVSLTMVFLTGSSNAIIDPDENIMGLYFDQEADMPCVDGLDYFDHVTMYLILTRPTVDAVHGFEAGFDVVGDIIPLSVEITCPSPCCMNMGTWNNIIVGLVLLPTTDALVLVRFELLYMNEDHAAVQFFLHGTQPSSLDPAYPAILLADGELMSTGISTSEGPTAQINGECSVVETVNYQFEQVKSLFR